MRKILKWLFILQIKSNKNRSNKLGRGFSEAYRINIYNPLSYILIIGVIVIGIIMFGVVGFWKEIDIKNPFKWN